MENNPTKSSDGIFLHGANPSPVIQAAMEGIRCQLADETAYRDRVRAGIEPAPMGRFNIWNISDRH